MGPGTGTLVIGLGNEHRHDDRCGLDVVRALRRRGGVDARIVEAGGDATALLELWEGVRRVFVVDAVRSGSAPGTVHRYQLLPGSPPAEVPVTSTHGLSLGQAVGLGRALGRLPGTLVVFGIEAGDVTLGSGLTPAVAAVVPEAVARLASEIAAGEGERHA